jgi:hypothetical protein
MTFGVRLAFPPRFAIQFYLMAVLAAALGFTPIVFALEPREYAIEASVEVLSAPFALRLNWRGSDKARSYAIFRRNYGSSDWGSPRATLAGNATQFTDTEVSEGGAYEYEIQMESTASVAGSLVKAYGYVLAGGNVSWPDQKGKVVLIVDATAASSAGSEIAGFMRDLIGAGWFPIRRDVGGGRSVGEVKNIIRAEYNADPSKVRSVILLGRVPVPYSGNIAPDLHASHKGAWPADVYYADVDGTWTDSIVDIVSGDYRANDNRPGDGKFDQSEIPSAVELEIGRIDFADLPSFGGRTAGDMLRTYLQKNHQFRHRQFTAERRGLIRDNFDDLNGDAPAVDAWRHYPQFFGPGDIRVVGPGGFFWTLNNESFLWAYGCGGGGINKADGVGTTSDFATQSPRAVFLILHGSYFGDWNTTDNFLRAAVAGNGYTLASIWSGLPHWYMHPMGLGASVGAVTRLTQNNFGQYKSHQNFAAGQVHIALIGDPTLEMFPVMPPSNLSGSVSGAVNLSWSSPGDQGILGYHVYYSTSAEGPFQRLTTSPIATSSYSHQIGAGTHHYMVRAVKLERTGSGTFYNLSQGIFTTVNRTSGGTPVVSIAVEDGTVSENGPNSGTVRISRSFAEENPLAVDFQVGGTAQGDADYNAIGTSVVIPERENNVLITITPVVDNVVEGEETITMQLQPSSRYTVASSASIALSVEDVNEAPTITELPDQTVEAGSASAEISFEVSDAETSAAQLQVRATTSNELLVPQDGIVLGGTGTNRTIRISAAADGTGSATIAVLVSDGVNEVASAFDVSVVPPNLPPVAFAQSITTLENNAVSIVLTGQDPETNALSFLLKNPPLHGALTGAPPAVTYIPNSNYFGADSFTFSASDGRHESAPAEVLITVTQRNRAPTASPITVETGEDTAVEIALSGTDPNHDDLIFEIVAQPSAGTLSGTNGLYSYIPQTNFFGIDTITFRVRDQEFASEPATVTLNIQATNDPPMIAAILPQRGRKNSAVGPITLSLEDVDTRASELLLSADSSNYSLVGTNEIVFRSQGTNRSFTITPVSNVTGAAFITISVSDGQFTNATSFELTITNTPPVAQVDSISAEDGVMVIPLTSLLANDSDADGDPLTVMAVSTRSDLGRSVVLTNESVIYHGAFSGGEDFFSYTVEDTSGEASSAVVYLNLAFLPHIESVGVVGGELTVAVVGEPEQGFIVWSTVDARTWYEAGRGRTDLNGRAEYKEIIGSDEHCRLFKLEWL